MQRNGAEVPQSGCYVAAVEFDESGSVVGYQMLQIGVFEEGMYSRDESAHLLHLHHMVEEYAGKVLQTTGMLTFTRRDEQGRRIGRLAQKLGYVLMPWDIYRRNSCH